MTIIACQLYCSRNFPTLEDTPAVLARAADEDGWADMGHGAQGWARVKRELDAPGIDHLVVEHDDPADHARFARRSLEAVKGW